jgi:Flp pilus assembly protein TadB
MESLSKFISSVSSTGFHMALIAFALILIVGVVTTIVMEKRRKDKYIKRIEKHREFSKEDVFEEFKEKNRYSDAFNKYVRPYIRKNPNGFHRLLGALSIDLQSFQRQLLRADVRNVTPEEIAALKAIGIFGFLFILLTTFLFIGIYGVAIALFFLVVFFVMPTSRLDRIYKKRSAEIRDILPTYLRLLANATSAGLTIEEAIRKVSRKYPCLLSEEFKKVENEAKYSNDWGQALENMAFKNDIDELYNLVAEIKITKEKGTPITEVLVRHADKIDMESTFTITERARKKATALILPIFLFLFTPLLAIILLPTFSTLINQM